MKFGGKKKRLPRKKNYLITFSILLMFFLLYFSLFCFIFLYFFIHFPLHACPMRSLVHR